MIIGTRASAPGTRSGASGKQDLLQDPYDSSVILGEFAHQL
jgi:hypothetical protein